MLKTQLKIRDDILKNVEKFCKKKTLVKVGVISGKEQATADQVMIAAVHELGSKTRNIPKRSFLVSTMTSYKDEYKSWLYLNRDKIFKLIAEGNEDQFLAMCGEKWKNAVKDTFQSEGNPRWKEWKDRDAIMRARKRRGHNTEKILWETGINIEKRITYEVIGYGSK